MNKHTKYYFLLKNIVLIFVVNLILGFLSRTISNMNLTLFGLEKPLLDLIAISKTLLLISLVIGILYLIYLVVMYYSSQFYQDYRINAFEAIYHGFVDIYQVYDKLKKSSKVNNLQVDFKKSILFFKTKEGYYSLKYLDLFGKIEGKTDSEFWASLSKPKTQYNQKVYTKRIKFPNPYRENDEYIRLLKTKTDKDFYNYVVISGFYNIKDKSDHILSPYEVLDFVK